MILNGGKIMMLNGEKKMEFDGWIGSYKVRFFPWIDDKQIYFNVRYYAPGQSIEKSPDWDKTIYITNNDAGQKVLSNFIYSLVEHVENMQITDETKVVLTF